MTVTSDPKASTNSESAAAESPSNAIAGDRAGARDEDDDEHDDDDRDPRRAAFLDELPDSEELRPLIAAFVDGNYALLRELVPALQNQTQDPEILAAALELVERTKPDPLSKTLLWLSILFFFFIVGWVYLHHAQ